MTKADHFAQYFKRIGFDPAKPIHIRDWDRLRVEAMRYAEMQERWGAFSK